MRLVVLQHLVQRWLAVELVAGVVHALDWRRLNTDPLGDATGIGHHDLTRESGRLEITETAFVADKARALHVLRQIKAMGVAIAIDDFWDRLLVPQLLSVRQDQDRQILPA